MKGAEVANELEAYEESKYVVLSWLFSLVLMHSLEQCMTSIDCVP